MDIDEADNKMFEILANCHKQGCRNESLVSLLSDMDVNIFVDKKTSDMATYEEWLFCVEKFLIDGKMRETDIVYALKEFLKYYRDKFGYELDNIIDYISEKYIN